MGIRRWQWKFFEILCSENNREACKKYRRYARSDQSGKSFRELPLTYATRHQIWTRFSAERTSYEKYQETKCLSLSLAPLLDFSRHNSSKITLENIKFLRKWPTVFQVKFPVEWLSENIPPLKKSQLLRLNWLRNWRYL